MELSVLKDVFFIGTEEVIDAFIATLKPRCIKPSTESVCDSADTAGVGQSVRLLFNTEDSTFISPYMHVFKRCAHCGALKPIDSFKTVKIFGAQQKRVTTEGSTRRRTIREETVCADCCRDALPLSGEMPENLYLVKNSQDTADENYLYVDNPYTKKYLAADGVWRFFDDRMPGNVRAVATIPGGGEYTPSCQYAEKSLTTEATVSGGIRFRFITSELEASDKFEKCPNCGRWFLKELHAVNGGRCTACNDITIYGYHGWHEELSFKSLTDENTHLYFGTEVETEGNTENRVCVTPYTDLFHLEHDGSLGRGGFEIISQPMSWEYLKANKDRIGEMFKALQNAGQMGHDAPSGNCGLHIHVSRNAFTNDEAIKRAIILVNGFAPDMQLFARRRGTCYCRYSGSFNYGKKTQRILDGTYETIDKYGHNVAVNIANHDRRKNTVEFRIFKSTLSLPTYLAAVEFVKNIVEISNDLSKKIIKFGDLIHGEFVPAYVQERINRYNAPFDMDTVIDFGFADVDTAFNNLKEGVPGAEAALIDAIMWYGSETGALTADELRHSAARMEATAGRLTTPADSTTEQTESSESSETEMNDNADISSDTSVSDEPLVIPFGV